jgi:hypothetical protein
MSGLPGQEQPTPPEPAGQPQLRHQPGEAGEQRGVERTAPRWDAMAQPTFTAGLRGQVFRARGSLR